MSPIFCVLFGEETLPTTNQETSWVMVAMATVTMIGGIFTGLFGVLATWLKSKGDIQVALLTQKIEIMQEKLEQAAKDREGIKVEYEVAMSRIQGELKRCEERHEKSTNDHAENLERINKLEDTISKLMKST